MIFSSVLFTIITLIYSIVKYFVTKDQKKDNAKLYLSVYLVVVIVSQFFINLKTTNNICGFNQPVVALMTTLFPWIFIFGSLFVLLMIFPGWKSPFSNTFGFLVAKISGIQTLFNKMLVPESSNKTIAQVYEDNSLIINEITPSNFNDFWLNFSKGGFFNKEANKYKNQLYNLVNLKDIVSETVWYLLTGNVILSVTENYLTNIKCKKNAQVLQEQHEEWEKEKNKEEKKEERKTYYVRD